MPLFCSRDSIVTEDLKTHVPVAPFLSYSSEKTLDFIYQGPKWRQPFSQWRVALKEESETRAEIFFVFMPRPFSFQGFQRRRVGKCRRDVSGCTRAQTHTENDETGPHTCPRTHTNWALWSKQYDCNTHTQNCTSHLRPTCVISEFQAGNSCGLQFLQLSNKRAGCTAS